MIHSLIQCFHKFIHLSFTPLSQPISAMSLDLLEVRSVMHAPVVTLREQMRLGDIRCGGRACGVCPGVPAQSQVTAAAGSERWTC